MWVVARCSLIKGLYVCGLRLRALHVQAYIMVAIRDGTKSVWQPLEYPVVELVARIGSIRILRRVDRDSVIADCPLMREGVRNVRATYHIAFDLEVYFVTGGKDRIVVDKPL